MSNCLILVFIFIIFISCLVPIIIYFNKSNFESINKKKEKIVVGFMVRDGEKYLEKNLNRIISFLENNFETYEIIYIENDSSDKTIEILNKFKMNYPFINGESLVLKNKYSTDMCLVRNCNSRFQFLAYLRQKLLDIVIENYKYYDYYLLIDMDFIEYDDLELSNMFKIMIKNNCDAIFPISVHKIFNLIFEYDYGAIIPKRKTFINPFRKSNKIEKVDSAFSGFGLYSIDSIKFYNAKYNLECDEIEHIDFNKNFENLYMFHGFNPVYK